MALSRLPGVRKFLSLTSRPSRQVRRKRSGTLLRMEVLEERLVLSSPASSLPPVQPQAPGPDQHVLILSVDGLHQADVTDPNLAPDLTNILKLQQGGVAYTNASTTKPSDSFPGTLSYLTGAGPATTGVFYDDSYSRTLFAPGTTNPATASPARRSSTRRTSTRTRPAQRRR